MAENGRRGETAARDFGKAVEHVIERTGISHKALVERVGVEDFTKKELQEVISGEKALSYQLVELLSTALSISRFPGEPAKEHSRDCSIFHEMRGYSFTKEYKNTRNTLQEHNGNGNGAEPTHHYFFGTTQEEERNTVSTPPKKSGGMPQIDVLRKRNPKEKKKIYTARAEELRNSPLPSLFPQERKTMEATRKKFHNSILDAVNEFTPSWLTETPKKKNYAIEEVLQPLAEETGIFIWELEGLKQPPLFWRKRKGDVTHMGLNDPAGKLADALALDGKERECLIKNANTFFTNSLDLPALQAQREGTKQDLLTLLTILNPKRDTIPNRFRTLPILKRVTEKRLEEMFEEFDVTSEIDQETLREAVEEHNAKKAMEAQSFAATETARREDREKDTSREGPAP